MCLNQSTYAEYEWKEYMKMFYVKILQATIHRYCVSQSGFSIRLPK